MATDPTVRAVPATTMAAPGAPVTGRIVLAIDRAGPEIDPTGPIVRIVRTAIPIGIVGKAGGTIAGAT